jgi:hypothetical protein
VKKEMKQTPEIISSFDPSAAGAFIKSIASRKGLFLKQARKEGNKYIAG